MARVAKPFKYRGWWVSKIGGKLTKLVEDTAPFKTAKEALVKAQAAHQEDAPKHGVLTSYSVQEVAALYLDHVAVEHPPRTVKHYQDNLKRLVAVLGTKPIREITEADGTAYKKTLLEDGYARKIRVGKGKESKLVSVNKPYSAVKVNHFIRSAKTLFNWASKASRGYMRNNPWDEISLLPEEGRERLITDEEFRTLAKATDRDFRQVLIVMRYSAIRPGELRILRWDMILWEQGIIVIPPAQHKTGRKTGKPRVIPLSKVVTAILRLRQKTSKTALVFTNEDGNEWRDNSFSQRFRKLRQRVGLQVSEGENLVLYSNRHTRLTELGENPAVSGAVLQQIAGHTSYRMTQRYLHVDAAAMVNAMKGMK